MPLTKRCRSVGFRARVCRREKASSRWVSEAARLAAPWAAVTYLLRQARADQLQRPRDTSEQVVKVVRLRRPRRCIWDDRC